jgi:hypothetical protein
VLAKNNLKMALNEAYLYISVGLISGFVKGHFFPGVSGLMNQVTAQLFSLWMFPPFLSVIIFSRSKRSLDYLDTFFLTNASIALSLWAIGHTDIELPVNAIMFITSFILTIYPFLSSGACNRLNAQEHTAEP